MVAGRDRDGSDERRQKSPPAFRNRIWNAREAGERLTQYQQLAYLIIAWNAFKDDRPLKIAKFPNGKLTPKNYPEPK